MPRECWLNVGGVATKITHVYMNVGGNQKLMTEGFVSVQGTQRQWWPNHNTLPPPTGGGSTSASTTLTGAKIGNSYSFSIPSNVQGKITSATLIVTAQAPGIIAAIASGYPSGGTLATVSAPGSASRSYVIPFAPFNGATRGVTFTPSSLGVARVQIRFTYTN